MPLVYRLEIPRRQALHCAQFRDIIRRKDRDYYINLCRIITAQLTEEKFAVDRQRLDRIHKRLSTSFGILDADEPKPEETSIRFPSYFDLRLNERKYHATQKISNDAKGNALLSMKAPVDTEIVQWVLGWGDKAVVIKPGELKEKLSAMGKFLIREYGGR